MHCIFKIDRTIIKHDRTLSEMQNNNNNKCSVKQHNQPKLRDKNNRAQCKHM